MNALIQSQGSPAVRLSALEHEFNYKQDQSGRWRRTFRRTRARPEKRRLRAGGTFLSRGDMKVDADDARGQRAEAERNDSPGLHARGTLLPIKLQPAEVNVHGTCEIKALASAITRNNRF
jgi:hypothetical protein